MLHFAVLRSDGILAQPLLTITIVQFSTSVQSKSVTHHCAKPMLGAVFFLVLQVKYSESPVVRSVQVNKLKIWLCRVFDCVINFKTFGV